MPAPVEVPAPAAPKAAKPAGPEASPKAKPAPVAPKVAPTQEEAAQTVASKSPAAKPAKAEAAAPAAAEPAPRALEPEGAAAPAGARSDGQVRGSAGRYCAASKLLVLRGHGLPLLARRGARSLRRGRLGGLVPGWKTCPRSSAPVFRFAKARSHPATLSPKKNWRVSRLRKKPGLRRRARPLPRPPRLPSLHNLKGPPARPAVRARFRRLLPVGVARRDGPCTALRPLRARAPTGAGSVPASGLPRRLRPELGPRAASPPRRRLSHPGPARLLQGSAAATTNRPADG